jgi:hypothetical protein
MPVLRVPPRALCKLRRHGRPVQAMRWARLVQRGARRSAFLEAYMNRVLTRSER